MTDYTEIEFFRKFGVPVKLGELTLIAYEPLDRNYNNLGTGWRIEFNEKTGKGKIVDERNGTEMPILEFDNTKPDKLDSKDFKLEIKKGIISEKGVKRWLLIHRRNREYAEWIDTR